MKARCDFSLAELERLIAVAREHGDERFAVICLLAVREGLRVSEICGLRRTNFEDGDDIFLVVQRLKGSDKTVSRLMSSTNPVFDAKDTVRRYLATLPTSGDPYLFTNRSNGRPLSRWGVNHLLKIYGGLAQISPTKLHSHSFKHSCGRLHRAAGASIETAADRSIPHLRDRTSRRE